MCDGQLIMELKKKINAAVILKLVWNYMFPW